MDIIGFVMNGSVINQFAEPAGLPENRIVRSYVTSYFVLRAS